MLLCRSKRLIVTGSCSLRLSPAVIYNHRYIISFMLGSRCLKMKNHLVYQFVSVCCFFAFVRLCEPAHVLPVCMINLFSLIIYVIQNVIYVSVNFELWPKRRIVNLSSQTLPEYTLLHSLVWSTHKSLQTGAEVHTLSFFLTHSLSQKLETSEERKQNGGERDRQEGYFGKATFCLNLFQS